MTSTKENKETKIGNMKHSDISTLTCACDPYLFLWEDYTKLFNKYWLLNTHNVVVGETKSLKSKNFDFIAPGRLKNSAGKDLWGKRTLLALEKIKTPYVFCMLIDYYFVCDITKDFIEKQIDFLNTNNANKLLLDEYSPFYDLHLHSPPYYRFDNKSSYQTSLMPAIWRTEWLKSIIKENDSPWDFETLGTHRIKNQDNRVYINRRKSPLIYNVISKCKFIPERWGPCTEAQGGVPIKWVDFKEKEQLSDYSAYLTPALYKGAGRG